MRISDWSSDVCSSDVPQPEFMQDEEIAIYRDAVGKFFDQHAGEKRVDSWRENGQVDREFWLEAGAAGILGMTVPKEYGGHGGDFRPDLVVLDDRKSTSLHSSHYFASRMTSSA